MLTQQVLKELLDYDPETGRFTRIKSNRRDLVGKEAGSVDVDGYRVISINSVKYAASRLAFLWMTGKFPVNDCDHEDGNPTNDRWTNLRDATTTQNMHNKRVQSNNRSGLKGVVTHKPGVFRAKIKSPDGRQRHLGLFDCPAAAHFMYIVAAEKYFGRFARAN